MYSANLLSSRLPASNFPGHFWIKMLQTVSILAQKWTKKCSSITIQAANFLVFVLLDFLDFLLCISYRFIDDLLEENTRPCYCENRGKQGMSGEEQVSETLYERKSIFRNMGLINFGRQAGNCREKSELKMPRWSDCRCESCLSWQGNGAEKLHFVVLEPPHDAKGRHGRNSAENVIFLHGLAASSSLWTETVFPNLSENAKHNYRFLAVDLLGFGRSPKPQDCSYSLKDHLGMIERSVMEPFQLDSFHLVAHSMGCIIALALAAKHPNYVKSITLISPPYFPSPSREQASQIALKGLADRKLWPPVAFGSAVMSWYEHIGRSFCFLICKNHRTWEWILKLLTRKRDLHFQIMDMTRHTHQSAWHSMHNVICGGARLMDDYFETVNTSKGLLTLIHGDRDQVVPLQCSYNIKLKVPLAKVIIVSGADHSSIVSGREKDLTRDLEEIWSLAEEHNFTNK